MSKLRSVSTAFWSDPFIEDLTPSEKLLFLYLITNDKTNMLGIYEVSIKKISYDTGLNKEVIEKSLKEFERLSKVKYIKNHIVLVNFMKHQNYNTNMKKSAIDIYNDLPKELKNSALDISKDNPLKGFESLLNHYGMVSKYEVEVELEYEVEVELENITALPKFSFYQSLLNYGFKKELVSDWLKVRKTKKATNTETAFQNFIKEIEKRNLNINEILEFIVIKNWSSFKWTWYDAELEKEKSSAKKENEPIVAGRQTMSTIQSNSDWSMIENPYVKK
jgi:hypothetical protein